MTTKKKSSELKRKKKKEYVQGENATLSEVSEPVKYSQISITFDQTKQYHVPKGNI
jgi:hypothetical protein